MLFTFKQKCVYGNTASHILVIDGAHQTVASSLVEEKTVVSFWTYSSAKKKW